MKFIVKSYDIWVKRLDGYGPYENNEERKYITVKIEKFAIYYGNKLVKDSFNYKEWAQDYIKNNCSFKGIDKYINSCNKVCDKEIKENLKIKNQNEIIRKKLKDQLKKWIRI